jgi:NADH-quinone oxidoreductase subunit L
MLPVHTLILTAVLTPLLAGLSAGLFAKQLGRRGAHALTIGGVFIALMASLWLAKLIFIQGLPSVDTTFYTWAISGNFTFKLGFLIDRLSVLMLLIVTSISLLVHIYSIGYMHDDPGYQRFFSYISLFTFAMLMLVTADNFLQLFFGWEGVGLVSYLLIGFWFKRESANQGSLKAFLVNRVGDLGFLMGIATLLAYAGSIDYQPVFAQAAQLLSSQINILGHTYSVLTVSCLLLFVGAMGKSAQVPLHVWLPESMEGPTPISALIHAATMVTAGVYMVARMSPLYSLSTAAQSVILVIGATGALFLGLIAVVQTDIKRVVAYSTLSQLGYMVAGLGAGAYAASIFHLATHACFKALLFLGAGSVILAMHHEQDMFKMGNLRRYMPITYITFLLGALSLSAIPPFAGFYSKDAIIEAVHEAAVPGACYAYVCVLLGAFVTALYTFRALFLTFHTQERMDKHTQEHLHESPWVVWLPLVILAIPSVVLGMQLIKPILYGDLLSGSVVISAHEAAYPGIWQQAFHALQTAPFWLAVAGIFIAWLSYVRYPQLPAMLMQRFSWIYQLLVRKYGFDALNQWVFAKGSRRLGQQLYQHSDLAVIDNTLVNGSARFIACCARLMRRSQSGYLYHYALVMLAGIISLLAWVLWIKV